MKHWEIALRVVIGLVLVALFVASACGLVVRQHESAVVTRFGKTTQVITQPGLYGRLPYPIDNVFRFDSRIRVYDTRFAETLTRDKLNIIVLTYVAWRVADPLRFFQAVGTDVEAERKLDSIVTDAKNTVLGNHDKSALVSTRAEDLKMQAIEKKILGDVAPQAKEKFGIEVLQVGIKRLAYPEENVRYVFDQMRAERARFQRRFRAEGERKAAAIRSDTDLNKSKILAGARRRAEEIRGKGEAEAARIYADAYKKDPDFYMFLRSLDSVKKVLGARSTVILGTDAPPFSILRDPAGLSASTMGKGSKKATSGKGGGR